MAKHQWLTPHQKGIVRRYYEHKGDIAHQDLAEMVSDLYLCTDEKQADRLWKKARTALVNAGVHEGKADRVTRERSLDELASIVSDIF
jgi:hypothetical protein